MYPQVLRRCLAYLGLDHGVHAAHVKPGRTIVRVDQTYLRPAEVESLVGDARKAREKLKWIPRTTFAELVTDMTTADLVLAEREKAALGRGLKVYRPDLEGK